MFEAHAATMVGAADAMTRLVDGGSRIESKSGSSIASNMGRRHHSRSPPTVRKTFLTPFDRGAITSLIGAMDDAIDEMQAAARAIDLYELDHFAPEMKRMVAMIVGGRRPDRRSDAVAAQHRQQWRPPP